MSDLWTSDANDYAPWYFSRDTHAHPTGNTWASHELYLSTHVPSIGNSWAAHWLSLATHGVLPTQG